MTQHEYIEELSRYLKHTYDVTVSFEKGTNWSSGYGLIFNYNGSYQRRIGFNPKMEDWKDRLYKQVNDYLKARGLLND